PAAGSRRSSLWQRFLQELVVDHQGIMVVGQRPGVLAELLASVAARDQQIGVEDVAATERQAAIRPREGRLRAAIEFSRSARRNRASCKATRRCSSVIVPGAGASTRSRSAVRPPSRSPRARAASARWCASRARSIQLVGAAAWLQPTRSAARRNHLFIGSAPPTPTTPAAGTGPFRARAACRLWDAPLPPAPPPAPPMAQGSA